MRLILFFRRSIHTKIKFTGAHPSHKLRSSFIDYFKSYNHKVIPSSSLLPYNDPTLEFVNAGMNQVSNRIWFLLKNSDFETKKSGCRILGKGKIFFYFTQGAEGISTLLG